MIRQEGMNLNNRCISASNNMTCMLLGCIPYQEMQTLLFPRAWLLPPRDQTADSGHYPTLLHVRSHPNAEPQNRLERRRPYCLTTPCLQDLGFLVILPSDTGAGHPHLPSSALSWSEAHRPSACGSPSQGYSSPGFIQIKNRTCT